MRVNVIDAIKRDDINELVEFRCKLPITWSESNHEFEVTNPDKGRYGLKVDNEGVLSTNSLRDIHDYLQKNYKVIIPGTIIK